MDVNDVEVSSYDNNSLEPNTNISDDTLSEWNSLDRGCDSVNEESVNVHPEYDKMTKVLSIWRQILGQDSSIEETFFEAGG